MKLVSIIVPIYNVEKYLRRCVDSLLAQTYSNIEIFLVDDGSPDNCGAICDEYKAVDSRINVIHKENGGLSDARNNALECIKGDYVTFVDSDDYVSPDFIKNLVLAIEENDADISYTSFALCDSEGVPTQSVRTELNIVTYTKEKILEKMLYQDEIDNSACAKLYKAQLFESIRYPKGQLYEDLATTYKVLHIADKGAVTGTNDYFYIQQSDSILHMKFNKRKMSALEYMQEWYEFIEKNYPQQLQAAKSKYISVAFSVWKQIPDNDEFAFEKNLCWKKICELRKDVLCDNNARRKARLGALCSYLGKAVCSFILRR